MISSFFYHVLKFRQFVINRLAALFYTRTHTADGRRMKSDTILTHRARIAIHRHSLEPKHFMLCYLKYLLKNMIQTKKIHAEQKPQIVSVSVLGHKTR